MGGNSVPNRTLRSEDRMSPEALILIVLFFLTAVALLWEAWRRRRGRRVVHTCPHCGDSLKSVEPGRRFCPTCQRYFRRASV